MESLERSAGELKQQYVVSDEAGVRADGSVTIDAARRNISVRGPTRAR